MPNPRTSRALAVVAAIGLAAAGALVTAAPASAADYPVTTEAQLIAAITASNASVGVRDSITITGEIELTADLIANTDDVDFAGSGIIDADGYEGLQFAGTSMDFLSASVTDLLIADASDAGIRSEYTHLDIIDTVVDDSEVGLVHDQGSVLIRNSSFTANDEGGAVISVESDVIVTIDGSHFDANGDTGLTVRAQSIAFVTISNTTANLNEITGFDGGYGINLEISDGAEARVDAVTADDNGHAGIRIANVVDEGLDDGGTVVVSRSTLVNNGFINTPSGGIVIEDSFEQEVSILDTTIAYNESNIGGAIFARPLEGTNILVSQVTASNNTANFGAGASFVYNGESEESAGVLVVQHSTFAENTANNNFAGLIIDWAGATIDHTVITDSDGGSDVDNHQGITINYSLIEDPDFPTIQDMDAGTGNVRDRSGELAPLALNGGPTMTRLPIEGSPLINTGDPAVSVDSPFDQRGDGYDRIVAVIDIGAVEVQAPLLAATGVDARPLVAGALVLVVLGFVLIGRRRLA